MTEISKKIAVIAQAYGYPAYDFPTSDGGEIGGVGITGKCEGPIHAMTVEEAGWEETYKEVRARGKVGQFNDTILVGFGGFAVFNLMISGRFDGALFLDANPHQLPFWQDLFAQIKQAENPQEVIDWFIARVRANPDGYRDYLSDVERYIGNYPGYHLHIMEEDDFAHAKKVVDNIATLQLHCMLPKDCKKLGDLVKKQGLRTGLLFTGNPGSFFVNTVTQPGRGFFGEVIAHVVEPFLINKTTARSMLDIEYPQDWHITAAQYYALYRSNLYELGDGQTLLIDGSADRELYTRRRNPDDRIGGFIIDPFWYNVGAEELGTDAYKASNIVAPMDIAFEEIGTLARIDFSKLERSKTR